MPIFIGSLSKAAQSKGKESLHTSFVKAGGQPAVASQAGNTDEISLDDDDEEDEEEEEGAPATKKNIGGSLTLSVVVFHLDLKTPPRQLRAHPY